jgi:NAD(P)-dependent dehydrogenase (short-subunit alcohol dehydrogenase family)
MNVEGARALVTGGSRGLGLGLVEVLVERGANVTVVARDPLDIERQSARLAVRVISADATDKETAERILAEVRPDILVLNAGAVPRMGSVDELSWEDFSRNWNTDVKAGLVWMQAALNLPLRPDARVLVTSSGAAVEGSPLSGGYAGAKRMLWLLAKYANGVAAQKGLGIRFQAIVPRQIIGGTGIGDEASAAYAAPMGMEPSAFLDRFGTPLLPRLFGEQVAAVLEDPQFTKAVALNLNGMTGVTILEGAAD